MSNLLIHFFVYIGIFIYGMIVLQTGLYQFSYQSIQKWISKMVNHPVKGMIFGAIATAILQSSSLTMVLTIGFITIGVLKFEQAVGIILGVNIGTTITGEIMTLANLVHPIPFVIIGFILLFVPHQKWFGFGATLFGIGSIFVAMQGFESFAAPLLEHEGIKGGLLWLKDSALGATTIGTIFTAIIQSSSATTGVLMGILNQELIDFETAFAILLGANIGTCFTAWLASLSGTREAKLVAYAHIWLNVISVIAVFPFLSPISTLMESLVTNPSVQLAHSSVLFNVVTSLLFLPFVRPFTNFIKNVHGGTETE